jgi:streptomycin 6-kinase
MQPAGGSTREEHLPTPAEFASYVERMHGEHGRRWLKDLPAVQTRLAREWGLRLVGWLASGRGACVVRVLTAAAYDAVLKIPLVPSDTVTERLALSYWDGDIAPRVLQADAETGALLLEWVDGQPLSDEPNAEATLKTAVALLKRLHRVRPTAFPPLPSIDARIGALRRVRERHESNAGRLVLPRATKSRELAVRQWLASSAGDTRSVVLHGDLHPRNAMVRAGGSPVVIDPYGMLGEAARDAAYLALMLREDGDAVRRLRTVATRLQIDESRVMGHAYLIAIGAYSFRVVYDAPGRLDFLLDFIDYCERDDQALGAPT